MIPMLILKGVVKRKILPLLMDFAIEAVEELSEDTKTEVDDKAVAMLKKYRTPLEEIIIRKL